MTRFQFKNNTVVQSLYGPAVFDYVAISVNTIPDALILAVDVEESMNIIKGIAMIGLFAGKFGHCNEFRKGWISLSWTQKNDLYGSSNCITV